MEVSDSQSAPCFPVTILIWLEKQVRQVKSSGTELVPFHTLVWVPGCFTELSH